MSWARRSRTSRARWPTATSNSLFDAVIPFGQYRCLLEKPLSSGLDDATIERILAGNASPPSSNTLSSIWNFGGATARVARGRHGLRRSIDAVDVVDRLDLEGAEEDAGQHRLDAATSGSA